MQGYEPTFTIIDELGPIPTVSFPQLIQKPQSRKYPADRTRSPRWRAGSRRNKHIRNVKPFFSDWWRK